MLSPGSRGPDTTRAAKDAQAARISLPFGPGKLGRLITQPPGGLDDEEASERPEIPFPSADVHDHTLH